MTAFEYLKSLPRLPAGKVMVDGQPSNSEVRRWLMNRSVIINGLKPQPNEEVSFPIMQLVFFPKGNTVTLV